MNYPYNKHESMNLASQIKVFAEELGFSSVGITSADPAEEASSRLEAWIHSGYAASMKYLQRPTPRRAYPKDLMPEAENIICLAFNYYPGEVSHKLDSHSSCRIARYAVGTRLSQST